MATSFKTRLGEKIRETGTPLCCGIDPHPHLIPRFFRRQTEADAAALRDFCFEILPLVMGRVAAIKPQAAFFESFGAGGMKVLADFCAELRGKESSAATPLLIMDAKRGDIGSTAAAYAEAYLGSDGGFASDALTVNPYLGLETLTPFLETAHNNAKGVFILLRTSNPGAADLQLLETTQGKPLYAHLATSLHPLMEKYASAFGLVVGATAPQEAKKIRQILPDATFLIPGYGAQGASAADALAGLVKTKDGYEGGVINASRALIFPEDAAEAKNSIEWEAAITRAITRAIDDLRA